MLLGVMWINKLSFYLSTCFDIGSLCTLLAVYRSVNKNGFLLAPCDHLFELQCYRATSRSSFNAFYLKCFLFPLQLGNLSSTSLLLRLCVALFVDFIFLSTWTAIDPMTMETEKIDNKVNINGNFLFLFTLSWSLLCF